MRFVQRISLQTVFLLSAILPPLASAGESNDDHRRSMGNLRPDHRTARPAIQGSPPPRQRTDHDPTYVPPYPGQHDYAYGFGQYPAYGHGPSYKYDRYPSAWDYGPYHPRRRYRHPRYPYWGYPPPLYIPAEALYGPQAVMRFMGVNRVSPPPVIPHVIAVIKDEEDQEPAQAVRRAGNQRSLNLAWRFIGFGDARFTKQEYPDAYQRYKKAAQASPMLADAHFRQGYSLIALGRYEQAAKALKRGLELDPGWAHSAFRNGELYVNDGAAKAAHLDALAQAAVQEPNNADLLFLVGVFLHFDGQKDRARSFFERAARLAGPAGAHLNGFLQGAKPAAN